MVKNRRVLVAVAGLATVLVGLTACSGSSDSAGGDTAASVDQVLTIGVQSDTPSLDPNSCAPMEYCIPAYASFVQMTPEGEFVPDLATEWGFTDETRTVFRVTLREGVTFSDGSELTAQVAADSINRFLASMGPTRSQSGPAQEARVAGENQVEIVYPGPVAESFVLQSFSQQSAFTMIVGPSGQADPDSLLTGSDGVGPYTLDADQTVLGDEYVYVPNPEYFNQDAIKWEKVVIKAIQDPGARLSAIESSQIDWNQAVPLGDIERAEAAGLAIARGPLGLGTAGVPQILLADRTSGPLADEKVREAIQYAIPREQIIEAVYAGQGTPTSSLVPEAAEGFNEKMAHRYDYDPEKAKELLAEAGYADGFAIQVYNPGIFDPGQVLGQALAASLAEVGITLDLVADNNGVGEVAGKIFASEYPAIIYMGRATDAYSNAVVEFAPMTLANARSTEPEPSVVAGAEAVALAADADAAAKAQRELTAVLDGLGWSVPIAVVPLVQATNGSIAGVPTSFLTTALDPFSPVTEDNWKPAQ